MYGTNPNPINPKVPAASGGGGAGAALGLLLVFFLEKNYGDIAAPLEAALVILTAAALAFAAGWIKRAWPDTTRGPTS